MAVIIAQEKKSDINKEIAFEERSALDALRGQFGLSKNQIVKFIIKKNPISLTFNLLRWAGNKIKNLLSSKDEDVIHL